jgi:hypothetical protein
MFADVQVPFFRCYLTCGLGDRSGGSLRQRRGSPCREWLILRQMAPGLVPATLHGLAQLLAIHGEGLRWKRSNPGFKISQLVRLSERASRLGMQDGAAESSLWHF